MSGPIGIFDSGIGGLTVASAIHQKFSHLPILYFGDTAHMPYGDKSPVAIRQYADKISQFLYDQGCRIIVIACNTASCFASESLQERWGSDLTIVNVIDPVIRYLSKYNCYSHIGVIGTRGTIGTGIYARKLQEQLPGVKISSLATPLLAPLIEEGYFNNSISSEIIAGYLHQPLLKDIDCLVLACTHYPLIKNQIAAILGPSVALIDSSQVVATDLTTIPGWAQFLAPLEGFPVVLPEGVGPAAPSTLVSTETNLPTSASNHFYVSDFTDSFQQSTKLFFGEFIELHTSTIFVS